MLYSRNKCLDLIRGDLSEVRRDGIFVRGEGENFRVAPINCSNSTKEIGPCDLVIVAVKATSNSDLVDLDEQFFDGD